MANPTKPSDWKLEPGKRYLAGRAPVGEGAGLSQSDIEAAENFAWEVLISTFAGMYDVSEWGDYPPNPLFEVWDLIASGAYLRFVLLDLNRESGREGTSAAELGRLADEMIARLMRRRSPYLYFRSTKTGEEGQVIHPVRVDYGASPRVWEPAAEFFPDLATDRSHGRTTIENFETLFRDLTVRG